MKARIARLTTVLMLTVFFASCFLFPPGGEDTGTLEFRLTYIGTQVMNKAALPAEEVIYTLPLIDISQILYKMEISTDTIYDGCPFNQKWLSIYETNEEMLNSERNISAEVPPGQYKALHITQRNMLGWIGVYQGDTLDWKDKDGNGIYNPPVDSLDNWFLPDSITTMADFIVEYLP